MKKNRSLFCKHPGCLNRRWAGPKGDNNHNISYCEQHQRQYWREQQKHPRQVGRR